jgi:DNA ligase-1
MKSFAVLFSELDRTTKTNEKISAMAAYFTRTDVKDGIWAIALLTGRKPKRPIRSNDLKAWATELAGIPFWLFEESYSVVGDLAETISLLVPLHESGSEKSLNEVMQEILLLPDQPDEIKKEWLYASWRTFSADELFVFNKLITGSFRVGVSQQLVFKALAKAYSIDEKTVAHKLMGSWLPQNSNLHELLLSEETSSDHTKP